MSPSEVHPLTGRTIVLAICGSVAAPKAFTVLRQLQGLGATVEVLMSEHADQFLGPWAIKGITGTMPYMKLFDPPAHIKGEPHITLARNADCMLVLPATDNFIANFSHGIPNSVPGLVAKNMSPSSILIAPAMSQEMWSHPATQENVARVTSWGTEFVGPVSGLLASGEEGIGRMVEPDTAVSAVRKHIGMRMGDLKAVRILVSAGGLRESIDGVRYLANASSGRQGYALAEAARDRGAEVTLLTASTLPVPEGLHEVVSVKSHADLKKALNTYATDTDVYIGAAAVSDYRYPEAQGRKLKRDAGKSVSLKLEATEDLIQAVAKPGLLKVAFAAETHNHREFALSKLKKKGAGLIVLNDVSRDDIGFTSDRNQVTLYDGSGMERQIPEGEESSLSKFTIAWKILDAVLEKLSKR